MGFTGGVPGPLACPAEQFPQPWGGEWGPVGGCFSHPIPSRGHRLDPVTTVSGRPTLTPPQAEPAPLSLAFQCMSP